MFADGISSASTLLRMMSFLSELFSGALRFSGSSV